MALQRQLEQYDRAQGIWRGTGKTLPAEVLADEPAWRAALANLDVARDIDLGGHWYPAVVLEVSDEQMRIGVDGVANTETEPQVIPRKDIGWMPGSFRKTFEPGDVVHVRKMARQ